MCPWQNGRIERLFGTLKSKLSGLVFDDYNSTSQNMKVFKFWYNHIRTHDHLGGRTPFEVYNGLPMSVAKPHQKPDYFSAWHGSLSGYWFR